jgi:copper transport protein
MLAAFLLRRANVRELGAILPVWSNWAMLAVTVLVLSGAAQALIEIGTVHALLYTTYGRLVLVKIGLLATILLFAQRARLLVQRHAGVAVGEGAAEPVPAYAGVASGDAAAAPLGGPGAADDSHTDDGDEDVVDAGGGDDAQHDEGGDVEAGAERRGLDGGILRRLRRSVLVELGIAVAVLVATAALVQSSPGRAADAQAALDADATNLITLNSSLYSLQVEFLPNNGLTEIHLFATTPEGAPLRIDEWKITATLPARSLGPIPATVTPITDSHAIGEINLTVKGNWTFAFTLRVGDFNEATVTTVVPIN